MKWTGQTGGRNNCTLWNTDWWTIVEKIINNIFLGDYNDQITEVFAGCIC